MCVLKTITHIYISHAAFTFILENNTKFYLDILCNSKYNKMPLTFFIKFICFSTANDTTCYHCLLLFQQSIMYSNVEGNTHFPQNSVCTCLRILSYTHFGLYNSTFWKHTFWNWNKLCAVYIPYAQMDHGNLMLFSNGAGNNLLQINLHKLVTW